MSLRSGQTKSTSVSFDEDVGLGRRETAVIEEGVEAGLEVSAGVGDRRCEPGSCPSFVGWRSASSRAPGSRRRSASFDDLLELVFLEDAGEVELGAGGGGDGDAVVGRDLVGRENGSVKEEALTLARCAPRGRDLDPPVQGTDAPERRRPIGGSARRRSRGSRPSTALAVRPRGGPRRTPRGEEGGACPIRSVARSPASRSRRRPAAHARPPRAAAPQVSRSPRPAARSLSFTPYAVVNVRRPWLTPPIVPTKPQQNSLPQCRSSNPHSPSTLMTSRLSRPPSNSA